MDVRDEFSLGRQLRCHMFVMVFGAFADAGMTARAFWFGRCVLLEKVDVAEEGDPPRRPVRTVCRRTRSAPRCALPRAVAIGRHRRRGPSRRRRRRWVFVFGRARLAHHLSVFASFIAGSTRDVLAFVERRLGATVEKRLLWQSACGKVRGKVRHP